MKIKQHKISVLVVFSILMMAFIPGGEKAKRPIYLNPAYSFKERAADLVSRMTPEEKQNQTHLLMFRSTTSA
jgi:beta-glucosidase